MTRSQAARTLLDSRSTDEQREKALIAYTRHVARETIQTLRSALVADGSRHAA